MARYVSRRDILELMEDRYQHLLWRRGGETAEMPGFYKKNEFDIAGFSVGVVERENLLYKNNIKSNSIIIGLESSGFHSNGFSLIQDIEM